jgi:hypothetical protein
MSRIASQSIAALGAIVLTVVSLTAVVMPPASAQVAHGAGYSVPLA